MAVDLALRQAPLGGRLALRAVLPCHILHAIGIDRLDALRFVRQRVAVPEHFFRAVDKVIVKDLPFPVLVCQGDRRTRDETARIARAARESDVDRLREHGADDRSLRQEEGVAFDGLAVYREVQEGLPFGRLGRGEPDALAHVIGIFLGSDAVLEYDLHDAREAFKRRRCLGLSRDGLGVEDDGRVGDVRTLHAPCVAEVIAVHGEPGNGNEVEVLAVDIDVHIVAETDGVDVHGSLFGRPDERLHELFGQRADLVIVAVAVVLEVARVAARCAVDLELKSAGIAEVNGDAELLVGRGIRIEAARNVKGERPIAVGARRVRRDEVFVQKSCLHVDKERTDVGEARAPRHVAGRELALDISDRDRMRLLRGDEGIARDGLAVDDEAVKGLAGAGVFGGERDRLPDIIGRFVRPDAAVLAADGAHLTGDCRHAREIEGAVGQKAHRRRRIIPKETQAHARDIRAQHGIVVAVGGISVAAAPILHAEADFRPRLGRNGGIAPPGHTDDDRLRIVIHAVDRGKGGGVARIEIHPEFERGVGTDVGDGRRLDAKIPLVVGSHLVAAEGELIIARLPRHRRIFGESRLFCADGLALIVAFLRFGLTCPEGVVEIDDGVFEDFARAVHGTVIVIFVVVARGVLRMEAQQIVLARLLLRDFKQIAVERHRGEVRPRLVVGEVELGIAAVEDIVPCQRIERHGVAVAHDVHGGELFIERDGGRGAVGKRHRDDDVFDAAAVDAVHELILARLADVDGVARQLHFVVVRVFDRSDSDLELLVGAARIDGAAFIYNGIIRDVVDAEVGLDPFGRLDMKARVASRACREHRHRKGEEEGKQEAGDQFLSHKLPPLGMLIP